MTRKVLSYPEELPIRLWAKNKRAEKTMLYNFGNDDQHKREFERRHKSVYGITPKFLDKIEARAFQAADFAGWKVRDSAVKAIKDDHTLQKGIMLLRSVEMPKAIPQAGCGGA